MQKTEHYNLSKPERTDPFRAQDVADNLDVIDGAIYAAAQGGTQPSAIVDLVYPVGSIYMSASQAEPSTLFGGTWQRLKDCMLMAAGDTYAAGDTGGAAAHTLTAQEMPSHKHTVPAHGHGMTQAAYTLPDHVHSAATDVKGSHRHVQRIGTNTFVVGSNDTAYTDGVKESGRYVTQDAAATTYRNVTAWAGDHSHSVNVGNPTTHPSCTRTQNAAVSDKPSFDTQATGGGQAFSTLPPYMTVNVWKRTA